MKAYGFHPEAREELREAAFYYESQRTGLGRRFALAVLDAVRRIRVNPSLYREVEPRIRQCRVLRFPYGLIYRNRSGRVEILAVMHLGRKPRYWRDRKGE